MDLTPYIDHLRRDLLQAAALGDEHTQRTAAALAATLESSARLALMNVLSDLAAEITGELETVTVEVKLDGADVRVSVEDRHPEPDAFGAAFDKPSGAGEKSSDSPEWAQAMKDAGSELSRTTVRLFHDLKTQAESAATDQGVSLNTYISRAVQDSVKGASGRQKTSRRSGRQVTGWIQG